MRQSFARRHLLKLLTAAGLGVSISNQLAAADAEPKAEDAVSADKKPTSLPEPSPFAKGGKNINVLEAGAVPDGKTLTTAALQKAIDDCAAAGGGTVTVPPGVYLTHTVYLKSGVELHLQKNAIILGDTDPKAFAEAVIQADKIENAAVTGPGVINGQGHPKFFPPKGKRHHDLQFFQCKNITVTDVTLLDSPSWVFRIRECDGVKVRGIRIYSYINQNNDGIDIDAKNVTISDCVIDAEDDGICLKSDSKDFLVENIAITNCIIGTNCNAIKFGTSSKGGFKNISISNCVVRWPAEAGKVPPRTSLKGCEVDAIAEAGIALEVVDGGHMEQVNISNIAMTGIQTPLFLRLGNRKGAGSMKHVVISGITATDETMLSSALTGIPGSYIENVILKDLVFNCKGTATLAEADAVVPEKINAYPQTNLIFGYSVPAFGMYARHVRGLVLENLIFRLRNPDARPAVVLDDCHNVQLRNFDAAPPTNDQALIRVKQSTNVTIAGYHAAEKPAAFVQVEGAATQGVKLTANDLAQIRDVVKTRDGAQAAAVKCVNNFE